MTLYKNKYRIESTRMTEWDYRWDGWYFVTICAHGNECHFGEIIDYVMHASEIGRIADRCWMDIPNHFHGVELDDVVIMPNHIHGIVIIQNGEEPDDVDIASQNGRGRDVACNVSTKNDRMSRISPKPKSLGAVVRSFKSAVTSECHKQGFHHFAWQPRFYDHLIGNEKELQRIQEYIASNVINWAVQKNDLDDYLKLFDQRT